MGVLLGRADESNIFLRSERTNRRTMYSNSCKQKVIVFLVTNEITCLRKTKKHCGDVMARNNFGGEKRYDEAGYNS